MMVGCGPSSLEVLIRPCIHFSAFLDDNSDGICKCICSVVSVVAAGGLQMVGTSELVQVGSGNTTRCLSVG